MLNILKMKYRRIISGFINHINLIGMKNTEKLREQLATEENNLKALGIGKQLIREERNERFEEIWLPKLQSKCNVKHDAQVGRYTFEITAEEAKQNGA